MTDREQLDFLLAHLPGCPRHGHHCVEHAAAWIKDVLQFLAECHPDSELLLDPYPDSATGYQRFGFSSEPSQRWILDKRQWTKEGNRQVNG